MAELDLLSDYMVIRDKGDPMLAGTIFAEIQIEGLTDKLPVKSETLQPVPNP